MINRTVFINHNVYKMPKKWSWRKQDWPQFTFDKEILKSLEEEFLYDSGTLFGTYSHLNENNKKLLRVDLISKEALKTSEIEGEFLKRESIQSSIKRNFGILDNYSKTSPGEQGICEMMIDLYGTSNKSKLGANAILGVSLAAAKAAANELGLPLYRYVGGVSANTLPVPMMNIINGGSHSDAPIAFQEFMVMPVKAETFSEAMKMGSEIFHNLKKVLHDRNLSTAVGDEGGFAPTLDGTEDAIETIALAVKNAGYSFGDEIKIALDCASAEFFVDGKYDYTKFEGDKGVIRTSNEQAEYLAELANKYPIISIEDGMDENDWAGTKYLTELIGDKVQLVGDDLFVTNASILNEGIQKDIANSILIKPNQIGSVSETMLTIRLAQRNNYNCVMSHRSGESEDAFIADFAVALNCGQIKTGSTARSDRIAKYNRLLEIGAEIGYAEYLGKEPFSK